MPGIYVDRPCYGKALVAVPKQIASLTITKTVEERYEAQSDSPITVSEELFMTESQAKELWMKPSLFRRLSSPVMKRQIDILA